VINLVRLDYIGAGDGRPKERGGRPCGALTDLPPGGQTDNRELPLSDSLSASTAGPRETDAAFENLRDRLRSLDTSEAMRRKSRACVDSGERVIRRLEEIVKDPTSVVLEFEG